MSGYPTVASEGLERTLSRAERDGIKAALDTINAEREHLQCEGLSQASFFLGIINLVLTVYVFGKWPCYMWVLYGVKCLVMIPAWFVHVNRVYHGALFVLDFCWVSNTLFGVYMVLLWYDAIPNDLRRDLFLTFYAVALGPLSWACLVLHNGIVFHSIERMTSLFIHSAPLVVCYTLVFHAEEVAQYWPGRFLDSRDLATVTMFDVYWHGAVFYTLWWVFYAIWLLSVGVDCPQKGYNTVFDGLYQRMNLGEILSRRTGLQSIRSHALLYMVGHLVCCHVAFAWAALCFNSFALHCLFGTAVLLHAAWSGAGYYEYVFAKKYTKMVHKMLVEKSQPLTGGA